MSASPPPTRDERIQTLIKSQGFFKRSHEEKTIAWLEQEGRITVRDMTVHLRINSPHYVIKRVAESIRKRGYDIVKRNIPHKTHTGRASYYIHYYLEVAPPPAPKFDAEALHKEVTAKAERVRDAAEKKETVAAPSGMLFK